MTPSPYEVAELSLPGVLLLTPKLWKDDRGFFVETYNEKIFKDCGILTTFVQDNLSFSKKGVVRGMHMQKPPHSQAKLVRCTLGQIVDVVADYDPSSPTFGKHVSIPLKGLDGQMVFVPQQYTHGFCVTSDEAVVEYKVSDFYHPELATGVRYDDPILAISWPVSNPILSEQDKKWPLLRDII